MSMSASLAAWEWQLMQRIEQLERDMANILNTPSLPLTGGVLSGPLHLPQQNYGGQWFSGSVEAVTKGYVDEMINQAKSLLELRELEARRKLATSLPVRILMRIKEVKLTAPIASAACYEVEFYEGRKLYFDDVDNFPSDADIARIALECT